MISAVTDRLNPRNEKKEDFSETQVKEKLDPASLLMSVRDH